MMWADDGETMSRTIILRALEERRVLELAYRHGAPRIVQPHAIWRKPDGTELLAAYQVSGFSEHGAEHGWKTFELARIDDAALRDECFEPRRDFRPVSGTSGVVVAQVRVEEHPDL